jgi:hypothetical protein
MVNRNSGSTTGRIAKRTILALALSGLLALGGCSSSTPPPGQVAAMEKTELHFSLDQCQPLDANLFKCPAMDKPLCNPDYNGQLECVRIGPKGSVFVQNGIIP